MFLILSVGLVQSSNRQLARVGLTSIAEGEKMIHLAVEILQSKS
jgi:hypothetical protein